MSEYLSKDFFERVQDDFYKYENDIEGAIARADGIERNERLREAEMEEDYKILETFGALM